GGKTEHDTLDARGFEAVQDAALGLRHERGDGDRLAPGVLRPALELADLVDRVAEAAGDRHPAVAELDDAIERRRTVAAHEDRRVRLLHGLRMRPALVEVDVLAMELRFFLRPQLFHREESLAEDLPAALERGAV